MTTGTGNAPRLRSRKSLASSPPSDLSVMSGVSAHAAAFSQHPRNIVASAACVICISRRGVARRLAHRLEIFWFSSAIYGRLRRNVWPKYCRRVRIKPSDTLQRSPGKYCARARGCGVRSMFRSQVRQFPTLCPAAANSQLYVQSLGHKVGFRPVLARGETGRNQLSTLCPPTIVANPSRTTTRYSFFSPLALAANSSANPLSSCL